jgi:haemagglutination activity domain protein
MNSKGTGNFKMMQGGRFVSTGKPVQATEGINYKFGNFVYGPKNINTYMKFIDFIEGYLPGMPSATKAGIGEWLGYQTLHPKEFYNGVIVNYDAIKSVFVDKDKK